MLGIDASPRSDVPDAYAAVDATTNGLRASDPDPHAASNSHVMFLLVSALLPRGVQQLTASALSSFAPLALDFDVDQQTISQRVQELGPWFHNIDLHGIQTAPEHFLGDYPRMHWQTFENALPWDLRGRTVLDVGCNAGFFAIKLKQRGADRVVGVDSDPRYLAQARLAAEVTGVDIEFREMTVYEVSRLAERFDIVLFMGVLYHLRHPLLALDLLHEHVVDDLLVFQSMLRGSSEAGAIKDDYPFSEREVFDRPDFPRMHFVEQKYSGDPTNWWIPNRACAEAMLRTAGFDIIQHPAPEVFVCRTVPLASREDDPALYTELSPAREMARRSQ